MSVDQLSLCKHVLPVLFSGWGGEFCPPGHFCQCLETFLLSQLGGDDLLLVSSGWRPAMVLNTLQCSGQSSTAKNDLAPNVKNTKVEKLCTTDDSWKYFSLFSNKLLRCFSDLRHFVTRKLASVSPWVCQLSDSCRSHHNTKMRYSLISYLVFQSCHLNCSPFIMISQ